MANGEDAALFDADNHYWESRDAFAGKLSRREFGASFGVPPSEHPEWYDRDERLGVIDDQGVEAASMFPSQGVVPEAPMLDGDVEAAIEVVRAFNRWIEDQWGFAYKDRIFGVPYLNMSDPSKAVDELHWCLDRGARRCGRRGRRQHADDGSWLGPRFAHEEPDRPLLLGKVANFAVTDKRWIMYENARALTFV